MTVVTTSEGVVVEVANPTIEVGVTQASIVVDVAGTPGTPGTPGIQGPPGDLTKPVADARYHRNLLTTAQWWVDAGNVAADGLSLVDLSGNNRPAVLGLTTQKPTVLPYSGQAYWYEPDPKAAAGTVCSLVTVPTATTSVQVVINGALTHRTDRQSQALQYGTSTDGWVVYATGAGALISRVNIGGTITEVTIKANGGYSAKQWHRFTYTKATGAVVYEDSNDGVSWTSIGSGTNNINATALPGQCYLGTGSSFHAVPGARYYASVTVDGVKVAEFDPKNVNTTTYTTVANTGTAGGTWTFTRATTGVPKGVIVDRPIVLFGGGQRAKLAAAFPDTPDVTMLVAVRTFGTAAVNSMVIDTAFGTAAGNGIGLAQRTTNQWIYRVQATGGTTVSTVTAEPDGQAVCALRVARDLTWKGWGLDGTTATGAAPSTWVGKHDNPVSIGLAADGAGYYGNFELIAAAIFDRALTDAEIAQASAELLGQPYPGTDANGNMSIVGNFIQGKAPSAVNHVPRLARVPNAALGDLGLPGYVGSDTGWRDMTASLDAGAVTSGNVYLKRAGDRVLWRFANAVLAAGTGPLTLMTLAPAGFRAHPLCSGVVCRNNSGVQAQNISVHGGALSWQSETSLSNGAATLTRPTVGITGTISVPNADELWPASLPGTQYTPPVAWT